MLNYAVLIMFVILVLYPLVYVLSASFSSASTMPTLPRQPRSPAGDRPSRKAISARGSRSASPSETAARRSGSSSRRTPPLWATGTPGNNGKIDFARPYWSAAGCAESVGDRSGDFGRDGNARRRPPPPLRGRRSARRRSFDASQPTRRGGGRPGPRRSHVGATPPASGRPRPLAEKTQPSQIVVRPSVRSGDTVSAAVQFCSNRQIDAESDQDRQELQPTTVTFRYASGRWRAYTFGFDSPDCGCSQPIQCG